MLLRGCLIIIFLGMQVAFGQQKPNPDWVNQKYSMFIHWGLYSQLGGVWKGEPVPAGYSEQIQSFASIPKAEYMAVAQEFNPVKWNADSVVALAKAAGMKSIVFTSKHHDGFCMYHSKYTTYNIVDATPFKRDVMKELSEACARQGIKFAVYFSLIDWNFPGNSITPHNADAISDEHHAFNMKQVEEILRGYGPVSELWFDMGSLRAEQSKELYDLVSRLQSKCMVSGRLGNDRGDFAVMADNAYPDYKIGVPWQTAASFFHETWGYRSWQERGNLNKKIEEKLSSLINVVSRGGNFLMNIGPRGDGSVVGFERDALLALGKWLNQYGEAIYSTTANPFDHEASWGNITRKGNNLYLFVNRIPANRTIVLNGLIGKVLKARLMADGSILEVKQDEQAVAVNIPNGVTPDRGIVVVELELAGTYRVVPDQVLQTNLLTSVNGIPTYAYSSMDYYSSFRSTVGFTWYFEKTGASVTPEIIYTAGERGERIQLTLDGEMREVVLNGGKAESLNVEPESVTWVRTYANSPKPDQFSGNNMGLGREVNVEKDGWKQLTNFKWGKILKIPVKDKQSVHVLHEINSDREQDVLVEVGVADGTQVVLNGKNVMLRTYVGGVPRKNEVIKLHLQKGMNQLVVKQFNCYGTEVSYMLNPTVKQEEYKLRLKPMKLSPGQIHNCSLRLARPANKNSDMGLRELRVELK